MRRSATCLLVGLLLTGCARAPATVVVDPLPEIDLTRFEAGLAQRLQTAIETLPHGEIEPGPAAVTAWYDAGRLLQAHGIEDLALRCYRNAMLIEPEHLGATYLTAYLEMQAGSLDAAAAGFETVATRDETAVAPLLRLGEIALQRGDTVGAETAFAMARERDPTLAAAVSGLGRVALARRDYSTARDFLETALANEPAADQLHYPLGLAYRGLGRLDEARDQLARRGSRQAQIPDPWLDSVRARLSTSQTHVKTGLAAYERGDLAEAARAYRRALEENPALGDTHLALAWVLEQLGDVDAAKEHALSARQLLPEQAMVHYQLGRLAERAGDDTAAAAAYRRALELDPDAAPPRELLAGTLIRRGEHAAAAEQYRRLLVTDTNTARLHYLYGLALLAADDCATAAPALTRARDLSPGSAEVAEAWIRVHATCAPGRVRESIALGAELFSALPEAEFAEAYAMALAAGGQYDRAVQLQQRVAASTGAAFSADLLKRFGTGEPASRPWPADAPVFDVPRLSD